MDKYYIVIADIHGESQHLEQKLGNCDKWIDLMGINRSDVQFVFLGDYIDRGHEHERVLSLVRDRVLAGGICLIGNHEDMMLGTADGTVVEFKESLGAIRTEKNSDLWQHNNGVYTCFEMFGRKIADPDKPAGYGYHVNDFAEDIRGSWMYDFLKEHGKRKYETHCIFFSHAPQSEKEITNDTLLWGNRRDHKDSRGELIFKVPGNKVMAVHGHLHQSSREKIYFPRVYNFEHGGKTRTVVMADCGCGSHGKGELHPVVLRERTSIVKGGLEYEAGVVAIL